MTPPKTFVRDCFGEVRMLGKIWVGHPLNTQDETCAARVKGGPYNVGRGLKR